MCKLFFCVGAPRSGKSTFTKKWLREASPGIARGAVNADSIRLAIHGERYKHVAEPFVWAVEQALVRHDMMIYDELLIDECDSSINSLKKIFAIDKDATPIYFNTPKRVCIERAHATGQSDLVPVIERSFNNLLQLCNLALASENTWTPGSFASSKVWSTISEPTESLVLKGIELVRQGKTSTLTVTMQ